MSEDQNPVEPAEAAPVEPAPAEAAPAEPVKPTAGKASSAPTATPAEPAEPEATAPAPSDASAPATAQTAGNGSSPAGSGPMAVFDKAFKPSTNSGVVGVEPPPTTAKLPPITYHKGRVLQNVLVYPIFWGSAWSDPSTSPSRSEVETAVRAIVTGSYMTELSQYNGVGSGAVADSVVVADSEPPNPFSNVDLFRMIYLKIVLGELPNPDINDQAAFFVFLPPGVVSDNTDIIGEHTYGEFPDWQGGPAVMNFVIAWVTNGGTLNSMTTVFSHELAEAATNPDGGGWFGDPGDGSWFEIGDACQAEPPVVVDGVAVQKYESLRAGGCWPPDAVGSASTG